MTWTACFPFLPNKPIGERSFRRDPDAFAMRARKPAAVLGDSRRSTFMYPAAWSSCLIQGTEYLIRPKKKV